MRRILNWFRQRKLESDLDRELQYHILVLLGSTQQERRDSADQTGGSTQGFQLPNGRSTGHDL